MTWRSMHWLVLSPSPRKPTAMAWRARSPTTNWAAPPRPTSTARRCATRARPRSRPRSMARSRRCRPRCRPAAASSAWPARCPINEIAHVTQAYLRGADVSGTSGVTLSARDSAGHQIGGWRHRLWWQGGHRPVLRLEPHRQPHQRLHGRQRREHHGRGHGQRVEQRKHRHHRGVAGREFWPDGRGPRRSPSTRSTRRPRRACKVRSTAAGLDAASLSVSASDESDINSIVGAVGLSAGKAGFGVSFAWNEIGSQVHASLVSPNVSTTGLTSVSAKHDGRHRDLRGGGWRGGPRWALRVRWRSTTSPRSSARPRRAAA